MQQQELSADPDTRLAFGHLQGMAEAVDKLVLQKQVKDAAQFVLVMDSLRIFGMTAEDIATVLGQSPIRVKEWWMNESLPDVSFYQRYVEKAHSLLRSKGILFAGMRLHPNTGLPVPKKDDS